MGNVLIQNLNQFPSHIPKCCISSDDVYALNASVWVSVRVCVYTFLAVKSIFAWSLTFKLSLNDNLFGRSLNLLYSTPSPYIDNGWLILCCCWCIEATHNVSHSIAKQFPCKHQYGDRITEVERRRLVSFKQII